MRLVYTADLHGNIDWYRALLELAVSTKAQAAIVGGDLFPHAISISNALPRQSDFVEQQLRPLLDQFHSNHPDIRIYLLPGNDDWAAVVTKLDDFEAAGVAYPLHQRAYQLRPTSPEETDDTTLWIAGYACVPLTPFSIKDYERLDDDQKLSYSLEMAYVSWGGQITSAKVQDLLALPGIAADLTTLAKQSDPQRTIYVCHTPPADTPIDLARNKRHIGSRALRRFVEQHAPPLTLHGHVHEAPHHNQTYAMQIGPTWCVNPGNDHQRFHAVTCDTDDVRGTMEHTVFGKLST
ncbi:MAG: metallophosphoesterase [Chloroflexi bacterium AL-W]|nr:metallophosphoesterase [Chloroflexi bacterium AL-N1]NOK67812.1 metallophosphoesterase [Chloroflexi bacterium AL-N10]NOK75418.1 metallophosphoesterase [Chloroflexi bacterium AL-N5]NOK82206.1 metallophosphoesterase [Chloroflexi bacterium AL-W]NOK90051.1 metallophosphoesterase [Chloroflexi bacterium AL-N15]